MNSLASMTTNHLIFITSSSSKVKEAMAKPHKEKVLKARNKLTRRANAEWVLKPHGNA